jgi:hypothetical protein
LASVLEVPHEFLFLGVHADSRVTRTAKLFAIRGNITELPISFGVRLACVQHLVMATEAVALLSQQAGNRGARSPTV